MGKELIPEEAIERKISMIRGHKVMLSRHLAELYGVEPIYKGRVKKGHTPL